MNGRNVAYSAEYQEHRNKIDYVFEEDYKVDTEEQTLNEGRYILKSTYYLDESHEVFKFNVMVSKTEVCDDKGKHIKTIKNVNHGTNFFSIIEHSNGVNYLLFAIDLYGYSVMNLSSGEVFDYIPEESFNSGQETFIWTSTKYCKVNDMLAVDGCYWACPFSVQIFDFSKPMELPLIKLFDSYQLDSEINNDTDVETVRWNTHGLFTMKCSTDNEVNIEMTINVSKP